ncbi:MAG: leucine--tRNA ligase [Myxococcales bacterium]|nr:leucine--tRNA ligase [Myxococcales bacterium]
MAYDHRAVESRWQRYWEEHETFKVTRRPGRPKAYVLDMFPYPSGSGLHVGHPEGYTATDIVARFKRMNGYDVLHPMGWDAFGLPAEQHAINTGTHPAATTASNINVFRRQLKSLGFFYDWSREVDTTDPKYVRWTQWIFLKLFERGLAFQAEIPVNWCPELGTVLANEEVIDGKSERGQFPVVRQPLRQWQLRITAYADRLAEELEPLDWPETRQKQRDWIGKSEGAEVDFPLVGHSTKLTVYTTRPDTLFGATYMVIAPDHPLTLELAAPALRAEVETYAKAAARKSDMERTALNKEKTGVATGAKAINPLNGQEIPIFTADYVLGAYGTGAIMAVPAHDERDFEFAQRFELPIVEVVSPDGSEHATLEAAFVDDGVAVRSGQFNGLGTPEMKQKITAFLEAEGIGRSKINYKLRDWVFSRQRYWGEPIPIYFPVQTDGDPRSGAAYTIDYATPIAVTDAELPLELPKLEDYKPGDPSGPLAKALDWRFFQKDGAWFARETNTMPQWAGSCWYYLRYLDPHNEREIFSEKAYDDWMPVDLYMGGSEHAVLHLLYARFWHKVLFDVGVVKHPEPFSKLVHQGMILGEPQMTAYRDAAGAWVSADLVRTADDDQVVHRETGAVLDVVKLDDAEVEKRAGSFVIKANPEVKVQSIAFKMSKSRGNVVNPDDVVRESGADSLRVYEMFMGPLEQVKPWQTAGIQGVRRFLDRVHTLASRELSAEPVDAETAKLVHRTVKKVGEDIEQLRFNTAVSAMMILTNHLNGLTPIPRNALEKLTLCLAPFAPHLAEELWEGLGHSASIIDAPWPEFDPALCVDDEVEMAVQINGKVRGRALIARDADEATARSAALQDENVQRHLEGRAIRKVVYVPGRILNLIVG